MQRPWGRDIPSDREAVLEKTRERNRTCLLSERERGQAGGVRL